MPWNKFLFRIGLILSLCLLFPGRVYGAFEETKDSEDTVKSGYEIFIDDTQKLLTYQDLLTLNASMNELVEYGNMVFISYEGNYSVENEIARSIYQQLYGSESGMIVYLDRSYMQISVYLEGDCKKLLTKEQLKTIMRKTEDSMKMYQYAKSTMVIFDEIEKALETKDTSEKMKVVYYVCLAIMISAAGCFLLLRYMTEHQKPSTEDLMWAANSHIRINHVDNHLVK